MYLCISQPPEAVWKMVPCKVSVVALSTMKGRKIRDENKVLRNRTGMTAFALSACFLKES